MSIYKYIDNKTLNEMGYSIEDVVRFMSKEKRKGSKLEAKKMDLNMGNPLLLTTTLRRVCN